jgi:hypothetical protein
VLGALVYIAAVSEDSSIGNIYLEMITAKNSPRAIDIIVTIEAIKIELRIKP